MENFDKRMALAEIEDALTDIGTPHGCGIAIGLCSAFYMCGLLGQDEWQAFMERIPAAPRNMASCGVRARGNQYAKVRRQLLN